MLTLKNVVISSLLMLAIGLSGWSIINSKKPPKVKSVDSPNRPDSIMEDVVATIINKEGKVALKIETPRMVHYLQNDTTHIEAPSITVYRESPEPWYIHSNYAKATKGIDKLFFWSNVTIKHNNDNANPMTTIKTDTLTVFPNKKIAATDDPITLVQPDTVIHATGMLADLNDGTVKLLSSTRGEYVPS